MLTSDIFTDQIKPDEPIPEVTQGRPGAYSQFPVSVDAEGNIVPSSQPGVARFGGTGVDGKLEITSGTLTLDLGSAALVVKNYSSISIVGTGALAFSNPATGGTIIIFKCTGNISLTSSTVPLIDLRNLGGVAGNGGAIQGGINGPAGGGGASANAGGNAGTAGTVNGTNGSGYGQWIVGTSQTGGVGNTSPNNGGTSSNLNQVFAKYIKNLTMSGSGGGGGSGGANGAGGGGGRGGGGLYLECAGILNFTGTINANGSTGADGLGAAPGGGGGGGGGAGSVVILANVISTNTGIVNTTGGTGGNSQGAPGPGGSGASGYSVINVNTELT